MNELTKLPNIGTEMKRQLNAVGIETYEQLKEVGSKEVWLILAIDSSACYNRLCGLEGVIQGVRWHYLSDEIKKDLKEFYRQTKYGNSKD